MKTKQASVHLLTLVRLPFMFLEFFGLQKQAALPQGIVPFVFAKEYNVHPDILSTGWVYFFCTKIIRFLFSLLFYLIVTIIIIMVILITYFCFCRVIFGMLIALPITLVYYILLGLWGVADDYHDFWFPCKTY